MKPTFTDAMLAQLQTMEGCANACQFWIDSMEAIGLDMKDEKIDNEFKRVCCERVREVDAASKRKDT